MAQKVIYPGTFDPITLGHMDIVKRIVSIFDHLIIGVAESRNKKTYFSLDERVSIIKEEMNANNLNNVEVVPFSGLLINFAKKQGVKVIIRGLRALGDFELEFRMAYVNNKMDNELTTLFIPATERGHFINSSYTKEIVDMGGDARCLVSENVIKHIREKRKK